jgi:cellulose synthase (UDP-forming)
MGRSSLLADAQAQAEAVPSRSPAAVAAARLRAAPSSNIAQAAWRFGERFPASRRLWHIRALNVIVVALMGFYLVWMLGHLTPARLWVGVPFAAASLMSAACLLVSAINSWCSRVTLPRPLVGDDVPEVAVIIPTCGEPVPMVLRTVLSVLDQDYPSERLIVVVSDDAHNPALAEALEGLGIIYHEPPDRWSPGRDGAAKAGNLNSAVAFLDRHFPHVRYIETRDADDEVGAPRFLRCTVGALEADRSTAFVQTVKEAQVSAGDPFVNFNGDFYRGQMLARNASNAVFPCGSGLVWRRTALRHIGGFPTWNLVEDFQSGVEALRRGWRGCYLPIVGAVAQHSPEDIPNVVKQRGTWAIDSVRLLVWGNRRGLSLRQRIAFGETLLFYLHSFTLLVYVPTAAITCLGLIPLTGTALSYFHHLIPYALAAELRLLVLNQPFGDRRQRQRRPLLALWRVKIMWLGLAPVYVLACTKAVLGGRHRKPIYKITRKSTLIRWYWRETLPQLGLAVMVPAALIVGAVTGHLASPQTIVCAGYWGLTYSAALAGFAARGWFGLKPVRVPAIERRQTKLEQRHASRRRPREAAAAHRAFRHEPHAGAGAPALTGAEAHR